MEKLKNKILWTGGNPKFASKVLKKLDKLGYTFSDPKPNCMLEIGYIVIRSDSSVAYWMNEGDNYDAAEMFNNYLDSGEFDGLKVSVK